MPRKNYGKKMSSKGRRKLGGRGSGRPRAVQVASALADVAPRVTQAVRRARAYAAGKRYYTPAQYSKMRQESLTVSDNISTLPVTVVGKARKLTFSEKVARVERPPVLFKRNFQFSAECLGGRKAWFNISLNHLSNDINVDTTTYKGDLSTDTFTADPVIYTQGFNDRARFYVDYMNTKLQLMNSGTNALTGKIHLFCYKRDSTAQYNGVPVNPVNLMMFYSFMARGVNATNFESTVGNGWNFDSATANYSYTANYNMPGSSLNSSGVCAFTDLALSPVSPHIKKDIGFWFKRVATQGFSLKPGQQCNKVIKFHDLPTIAREQLDLEFCHNMSYAIAVEFQGQLVGASDTANLVSTGSAQLSVIREDIRILGQKNRLNSKVMLQTAPLTTILKSNQIIVNPDSGTQLTGFQDDA